MAQKNGRFSDESARDITFKTGPDQKHRVPPDIPRTEVIGRLEVYRKHVRWAGLEMPLGRWFYDFPWDDENYVFTTTMRHPLWRAIAKDSNYWTKLFPEAFEPESGQAPDFYRFLTSDETLHFRDNYALRWLVGNVHGNLSYGDLAEAMNRIEMFRTITIIDDTNPQWWNQTMLLHCAILGWDDCTWNARIHPRPSLRVVIANDTLLADLLELNKYSIRLYEYSKMIAYRDMQQGKSFFNLNLNLQMLDDELQFDKVEFQHRGMKFEV